jgi:hypothetical protein
MVVVLVVVLCLLAEAPLVFTGSFTHLFWFFGVGQMALLFLELSGFGLLLLFFFFVVYT